MSDFTQASAEALGWRFVHAQEESVVELGDGYFKRIDASYRAEKTSDGHTINEEAVSPELLLERIRLYEVHIAGVRDLTVVTGDGSISDAELVGPRSELLYRGGEMQAVGVVPAAAPVQPVVEDSEGGVEGTDVRPDAAPAPTEGVDAVPDADAPVVQAAAAAQPVDEPSALERAEAQLKAAEDAVKSLLTATTDEAPAQ